MKEILAAILPPLPLAVTEKPKKIQRAFLFTGHQQKGLRRALETSYSISCSQSNLKLPFWDERAYPFVITVLCCQYIVCLDTICYIRHA